MTTWRPREQACAEIGSSRDPSQPLSVSAYKRARQVLEERGLLGLVAQGWTSALRAGVLDDRTATSAVFVLAIPRRKQRLPSDREPSRVNGPLTGFRRKPGKALRAREAEPEVTEPNPQGHGREGPRFARTASAAAPVVPLPSVLSLKIAARPWRRPGPCKSVPVCWGGSPLSISGTWPGRSSLRAGHPGMSCTRSTTSRAAASTATRPGCTPPPGGSAHAWPRGSARAASRCRPAASSSPRTRRQVLAEQAARRARDAAARAQAADYPVQADLAREMLRTRPRPGASRSRSLRAMPT